MKRFVGKNAREVSHFAAELISDLIKKKPNTVLGLPAGKTPIPIYRELVRRFEKGQIGFQGVSTFNLDEYVGLASGHPNSYRSFMQEHLFGQINVSPSQVRFPDVAASDAEAATARYEEAIQKGGGIDLQLLGIGLNGHIAFNEPGSSFASRTRVVTLAETTRKANTREFTSGEEVPRQAMTMGIGTILEAQKVILVALGGSKSKALAQALEGPPTEDVPASALRGHPDLTILADLAAAKRLSP